MNNVNSFNTFRSQIKGVAVNPVQFKALSNRDINITVSDENDYRNIKKYLKIKHANEEVANNPFNKLQFHTYELKSNRWYRIVIGGLPSSTEHDDIKNNMESIEQKVATATLIVKKINKHEWRKHQ